jgi:phosphoribosylanthranilate isomerase
MPLKTLVKVGNISNLSDARYCSGMAVDMLGFKVIEGQPNHLPAKLFQEIRGWISGPKVVAEIYGIHDEGVLSEIITNYAPEYFELTCVEYANFKGKLNLPVILYLTKDEVTKVDLDTESENIAYLMIDEDAFGMVKECTFPYPILLKVKSGANLNEKLKEVSVTGVALDGSPEERPGFKDYTGLSEILEALDE